MEEKKFCKFCGEEIEKKLIVCPKCGRQLKVLKKTDKSKEIDSQSQEKTKFYTEVWFMWLMLILLPPVGILFMWKFNDKMAKKTKIILSIVFGIIFLICLISGENTTNEKSSANNNNNSSLEENNESANKKDNYTLGDTIVFDNLELTFDKEYTFTSVDNRFSEHHEKDVIKIGVNVKNLYSEKHSLNMFFYELFGPQGTELNGISSYFEETVDFAGELKPNASYKKYFYILYDGNGTYSIDFDNYSQEISVEFNIKK